MDELKNMRAFARELAKLEEVPRPERLAVLRWLEIKIMAMVKTVTEDKQAGPT